jgi:hypothetical protein
MFFNLKHHIASLVAVFLALGLGILIGSAAPGNDALVVQQQHLAGRLETQLESLRQKNKTLQAGLNSLEAENNIYRQFASQVVPALASNKLEGHSIAIILTGGRVLPGELATVLEMAGARIQSTTAILKEMEAEDCSRLINKLNWPDVDAKTLPVKMAEEIAKAILTGDTKVTDILAGEDLLSTGGRYGQPVDDVVIIGGGTAKKILKTGSIDSAIIDFFKSRGKNVYGAEDSRAAYSYVREYQKKGISTVDNIDMPPGQLSLIYAISGRPGHYGVKPSAGSLLPALY